MRATDEVWNFVRCDQCQLVRLSPRPSLDALPGFYDSGYLPHRGAAAWGRFSHLVARANTATDRARCRIVERAARLDSTGRVLDLGCGRPTFLAALHARTGVAATGVDFSPSAWADAPPEFKPLDLRAGTLDSVDLTPGFDAITLWHALEHDPDPVGTLRSLRSLARPDAALVIEVPDHDSLTRRLQGPFWGGYHTPRHLVSYTPESLREMLERGGWRVERLQRHGTLDPWVLWWLGRQEQTGRDLSGSLESRFPAFVAGKLAALPITLLQRWLPLGVQLAVARPGR